MNKFQPKQKINYHAIVVREKSLIQQHFNFLRCEIKNSALFCYGQYQPTDYSIIYEYRIKYNPPSSPLVTVRSPSIEYNDDIHMYRETKALCLYHKSDLIWDTTCHLFDKIVPWTHEWFIFYELYQISGMWEHPFIAHRINSKK